jgi:hypothetical protein
MTTIYRRFEMFPVVRSAQGQYHLWPWPSSRTKASQVRSSTCTGTTLNHSSGSEVLTWVCLRYEDGKLLSQGRPLDSWLAVGANRCLEKKSSFLTALGDNNSHPSASHQENWEIVLKCWEVIYYIHYGPTRKYRNTSDREIFRLWLQVHVKGHLPDDLMFGE